jgi:hypothetical protein
MSTFTLWGQHAAYVGAALAAVAIGIGLELALLAAARQRLGRGKTDEEGARR